MTATIRLDKKVKGKLVIPLVVNNYKAVAFASTSTGVTN
jgi:hypothetical protein